MKNNNKDNKKRRECVMTIKPIRNNKMNDIKGEIFLYLL